MKVNANEDCYIKIVTFGIRKYNKKLFSEAIKRI
jgi:hypothetical protein